MSGVRETPIKSTKSANRAVRARAGGSPQGGRRGGDPDRRRTRPWAYAVGALALTIVTASVTFVVATGGNDHDAGPGDGAAFGHVHGLAIDPGDQKLLAATHAGLFRVDAAHTAVRVSRHAPDLMGFTVVGPDHYLASGHPGEGEDSPPNLGLIESTDGGETWRSLSLVGAADFHGLRAAHGRVYGHNSASGAFLVSSDRKTWQKRSDAPIGAFVVSPTDPELIVAEIRGGLARSVDGGRSWRPISGAPQLGAVSWETGDEISGADASGTVWHSSDAGQSWHRRGRLPGTPQAIAVSGGALYAAVAGDRLLASADGGATWTDRYRPRSGG